VLVLGRGSRAHALGSAALVRESGRARSMSVIAWGCRKTRFSSQTAEIWGIENVLRSEKIAYKASCRNFIFANFGNKEFFNISKYVGPCQGIWGYEFHEFEHTTRFSADALCPFDRVTSFVR